MLKRLAASLTFLLVLAGPYRAGWTHLETDFPNYYTAAWAVRQGLPLREYYDWTWFARQMNYAGIERQLGAYTPQTPLTMLPMIPLTRFSPQHAKQVWLVLSLVFLGAAIWLLSRMTRFTVEEIWLLAFCGYFSLRPNLLYGQYYLFLLFLFTAAYYLLHHKYDTGCGVTTAIAFGLKLYGGPFLLYYLVRREWKAAIGMIAGSLVAVALALALFGSADLHYYGTLVLPRTLEGGAIDPYSPGVPTFSTMLRHFLVREPELNPNPLWNAPRLFFFLRTFIALAVVAFLLVGISRKATTGKREFAWFLIALLLLSTNTVSYTFILLLLPLVLLLDQAGPRQRALLVTLYVLLTLPLHPVWLFPKVWLLFVLFVVAGWPSLRRISWAWAGGIVAVCCVAAALDASRHLLEYEQEPGRRFEQLAREKGKIFAAFPVVTRAGLFYQAAGTDRWVLGWLHDSRNEEVSFEGSALHPRAAADGVGIEFELVANRGSVMMRFDPATRKATPTGLRVPVASAAPILSPDGKWLAEESAEDGPTHIWLRDAGTGQRIRLTGGNCNSSSPAWALDASSVVFASDCGRAFGVPALYRAGLPDGMQ